MCNSIIAVISFNKLRILGMVNYNDFMLFADEHYAQEFYNYVFTSMSLYDHTGQIRVAIMFLYSAYT